ncbi:MAG TPA: hypothetical protein VFR22_10595 [Nocardioidaceae bacterium]|nr:hypothetical protein [Nocardioidaceae bacterium]
MNSSLTYRRLAGAVAVTATMGLGLGVLATPADAAGPTARLSQGSVTVTGTAARDVVDISMSHDRLKVDFGADGTTDARFSMSQVQRLSVQLGGGNDGTSVTGPGVGDVPITISGGGGNDGLGVVGFEDALLAGDAPVAIFGNDGNDNLSASVPGSASVSIAAGVGDDVVFGGDGSIGPQTISLGDGNDRFVSTFDVFSSPFRDRNDVADAGAGQDTLELRGTFESEVVNLSAQAGHLLVAHNQGHIDAVGFENVTWTGFGGNESGDTVIVHDLSGTGVANFTPDFTDPLDGTGPNNSADTLAVFGTAGDDHITVSGSGANITIAGLTPTVTPVNLRTQDPLQPDVLQINTLAGRDTVDSSGLQPGLVQLVVL